MKPTTCRLIAAAALTSALVLPCAAQDGREAAPEAEAARAPAPEVAPDAAAKPTPEATRAKYAELSAEYRRINQELSAFRREIADDPEIREAQEALVAAQQKLTDLRAAKLKDKPWLGIEYETTEHGRWAIEKVMPGSPAEKAGFEEGDVMLAVNGVEYSKENKKAVKEAYSNLEPGSTVTYLVKRKGGKVKLEATLGHVPVDVQKKWIQAHMTEYHPEMQMASK